jgi:segregation and condensation protein B
MDSEKRKIEVILFSAGRPLSTKELAAITSIPELKVERVIHALMEEYKESDSALEISKAGDKWGMQVKGDYASFARGLAKAEIKPKLLKTLALIAYHQPVKQSKLNRMIGNKIYDHVKELSEKEMIKAKQAGRTKILTTAPKFLEYFGIPTTDREKIRQYLLKNKGAKEIRS